MLIHFESGLNHRLVAEFDRNGNAAEISLHFGILGGFDRDIFPSAYTSAKTILEEIKNTFLRMVGAYLMNVKEPNEALLAEVMLICGKMHEKESKVAEALEDIKTQIKEDGEDD